jgi:3'(2'), 5'-bisphosphate nucleotidase
MISVEEENRLLKIAIEAAMAAGKQIMHVYAESAMDVAYKDDKSPLTEADKRSHAVIASVLIDTGIPVLSEEGREIPFEERKTWSTLWIVDPLDGTKEFIKRNGEFTVNIALVVNGSPILGVVYVPVHHKTYLGSINFGSWCSTDTERLIDEWDNDWENVADRLPDSDCYNDRPFTVVASRSHNSPETEAYIDELKQQHPGLEFTSIGSSLKICLVAEGRADVYPRFAPTMEWDTAAGHAILLGAGKQLLDYTRQAPMKYNREELRNNWFIAK